MTVRQGHPPEGGSPTGRSATMKIKIESEKIIKAIRKLEGVEMVLENPADAKEALQLILRKTELFKQSETGRLKDVIVTSFQEYKTSAVDYKMVFLLEFLFEPDVLPEMKVSFIKDLQEFFNKL
jgi:hypothetical protein